MFLFGKGCLTIKNNLQEESQARGSFLKIIFYTILKLSSMVVIELL